MQHIIALIGATCSGKSALALTLAKQINAHIFSIDSLSIYKEINIASAKPDKSELDSIKHYAINALNPNEHVSVGIFIKLLESALQDCKKENKNLVIVGGSSFYLKSILDGLSQDIESRFYHHEILNAPLLQKYEFLFKIDSKYANLISQNDSYRINKALQIFFSTNLTPSAYFALNPRVCILESSNIKIFNLVCDREILIKKINLRTKAMIEKGLINEAQYILQKYGENIQAFKSIGLKECLAYLRGSITLNELESQIAIHTRQLAKRQVTFNKTQFKNYHITALDSINTMEQNTQKIIESTFSNVR